MKGIILKNINIEGIDFFEELNKVEEEHGEFIEAVDDIRRDLFANGETTEKRKEHAIEEFYDTMQASLSLLHKVEINAEEVMSKYYKHEEKIKNRPRVKKG